MRSICLLVVQVAVEGEEWMVLAIYTCKYDYMIMAYFDSKGLGFEGFWYRMVHLKCL